jgi:hypothetical protein
VAWARAQAVPVKAGPGASVKRDLRRNLLLAVALAAVTAGVIIAATPRGGHRHDSPVRTLPQPRVRKESQLAADYLGLSRSELLRRLRAGRTLKQIAESIPGRSSRGLIEAMLDPRVEVLERSALPRPAVHAQVEHLRAKVLAEMNQSWRGGVLAVAAARVGLSEGHLRERLEAGETLAQIASSKSISRTALIDALVAVKAGRLEMSLRNGSMTTAEERKALASLRRRVARETDRKLLQSR